MTLIQQLEASIKRAEKMRRRNLRPISPKLFRFRSIQRIERSASHQVWYEVLSCGHRGHLAEGPNRLYIPTGAQPTKRRCYDCGDKA